MPRVPIAPENKTGSDAEKFPSLSFTSKGERQRIFCPDTIVVDGRRVVAPVRVWVHLLKAPKIMDGQALMKERKGKDGSTSMEWDLDFIGQGLCLGDDTAGGTMERKGSDPDNCITCRANKEHPEFIPPAQMYYAMNVVRYATQPGGWDVARPFMANIVAWKLTERRFNKLADIGKELTNGQLTLWNGQTVVKDLSLVDLRLGPCEDTGYQKYEIAVAEGIAVARSGQKIEDYVVRQIWNAPGARATDEQLAEVCGRRQTNLTYLQADIDRCLDQWHTARNAGKPAADNFGPMNGAGQTDIMAGLSDVLDEVLDTPGVADSPFDAPQPDTAREAPLQTAAAEPVLPPDAGELAAAAGAGGLDLFAPEASPQVAPAATTAGSAEPPDLLAAPEPAPATGQAASFSDFLDSIPES